MNTPLIGDAKNTTGLEQIIEQGTNRNSMRRDGMPTNKVQCADGFKLSVVAGAGTYCSPRPDFQSSFSFDDEGTSGPYTAVEVGFPSARPEPWAEWEEWCESPDSPTQTVYGYVPVEAVRALVALHGGQVSA